MQLPCLPWYYQAGFTGCLPCPVASGADAAALRALCPEMALIGGIDHRALLAGRAAIDAELRRVRPLVKAGGFIPALGHRCVARCAAGALPVLPRPQVGPAHRRHRRRGTVTERIASHPAGSYNECIVVPGGAPCAFCLSYGLLVSLSLACIAAPQPLTPEQGGRLHRQIAKRQCQ